MAKKAISKGVLRDVVAVHDEPGGSTGAPPGRTLSSGVINRTVEAVGLEGLPKTLLDHNRFATLSVALSATLVFCVKWFEPTVSDPLCCSGSQVTEAELRAKVVLRIKGDEEKMKACQDDVASMQKQVEATFQEIQADNARLASAINTAAGLAAPAAGPFAPLVLGATALITAGLAADGIRKRGKSTESTMLASVLPSPTSSPDSSPPASGTKRSQKNNLSAQMQQLAKGLVGIASEQGQPND